MKALRWFVGWNGRKQMTESSYSIYINIRQKAALYIIDSAETEE
jgi:hypothetical protein